MKFLKNIEDKVVSIKQMTIIKAFFVMVISILLEAFGQIPISILDIFSRHFTNIAPFINFASGVLVKYFVIIILLRWYSVTSYEQPHKKRLDRRKFIFVALIIIGFRLTYDNSLIYWVNKIPMPDFINRAFEEIAMTPIVMILTIAVIAPIYEEVIFRGILLRGMANKMNKTLALVVSALFFAMLHMNIPQGINAFFLGLIIGSIYLSTGSIYLCIFAHFINNSVGITISGALQLVTGKYTILTRGIAFVVGITILIIAYNYYKKNKTGELPDIYKQFVEI